MAKYDERSNQRRADLQSRQLEESMSLDRRIGVAKNREMASIDDFYGPHKEVLESAIDDLNERLNGKGIRAALYRSIHGRRDQEELERYRATMRSIDERIGERTDAFDSRAFTAKQNLATRHDIQKEDLEMDINTPSIRPRSTGTTIGDMAISGFREPPRKIGKERSR